MKGFKQCSKGHFFKEDLSECPYCPKASSAFNQDDKTKVVGAGLDKTSVGEKTELYGGEAVGTPNITPPKRDLNRTFIQEVEEKVVNGNVKEVIHQRPTRKITGWIISYTLDPMGIDYRIFEGNNRLGRNTDNDIVVAGDPSVSGHHATLLCKTGRFYLKDEMAANGTFVNGEEMEIGHPVEVKDGDVIRLGKTEFKFKSPL
jgi:hypothetical protein